jgi:succinoglycan biosynthesis protein ExoM
VLETEVGISFARNRAVEEALGWGADWIVFIDDDETADASWFRCLTSAMNDVVADVLHGPVQLIYPTHIPQWKRMKTFDGGAHGSALKTASTNNTAARAWLFSKEAANLHFSPLYSLSGGEDIDLFRRAASIGASIKWVSSPKMIENVVAGRLSDNWLMDRNQRIASNMTTFWIDDGGRFNATRLVLRECIRLLFEALAALFISLIALPHRRLSSYYFYKMKAKSKKFIGYIQPLLGVEIEPYRRIDGE